MRRPRRGPLPAALAALALGTIPLRAQEPVGGGAFVRYPVRHQVVVPDSNFLFGTAGSGDAQLEINGVPVDVAENGAFLAWLAVPPATRGDTAVYHLVVRTATDTTQFEHAIRRPPDAPPPGALSPWVRPVDLGDRPERWVRPGEKSHFEFVSERDANLVLEAGDVRVPVPLIGTERGTLDRYAVDVDLGALKDAACRAGVCREAPGSDRPGSVRVDIIDVRLVSSRAGVERRDTLRIPVAVLTEEDGPGARLVEARDPVNGESGVVVGRTTPFGPYRWRLAEGTVVPVTGRLGDRLRVALAGDLEAWVLVDDVEWTDRPRESARTWDARARAAGEAGAEPPHVTSVAGEVVTFRVGLTRPVPADVVVTGERSLSVTLYDTFGQMDRIAHGVGTGVTAVHWTQLDGPAVRIDLELEWPLWGYRLSFESGPAAEYEGPRVSSSVRALDDSAMSTVLRLDLRRPPSIDPGHPGGGSTGPSGLFEGDANLAVARRLVRLLEDAGAEPILIRTGPAALGLYERTRNAREAGAELFVSIHNNALPDGIRPFDRAGTTTYYHHRHAAHLARAVQAGVVERLGLRDLGVVWGDLAVAREPWMPAVLVEGAFMIIPDQETALRSSEFQEIYARGVLEGIERFLAEVSEDAGKVGSR